MAPRLKLVAGQSDLDGYGIAEDVLLVGVDELRVRTMGIVAKLEVKKTATVVDDVHRNLEYITIVNSLAVENHLNGIVALLLLNSHCTAGLNAGISQSGSNDRSLSGLYAGHDAFCRNGSHGRVGAGPADLLVRCVGGSEDARKRFATTFKEGNGLLVESNGLEVLVDG